MKPIQDPQTVLQAPAPSTQTPQTEGNLQMDMEANGASADIADLEQIVKTSIEQHGAIPATSKTEVDGVKASNAEEEDPVKALLKKREYVLKELVETEEVYVIDLRLIVEGYMAHIQDHFDDPPLPESLRDRRSRMIFGNIEIIFEWHRDKFLEDLRKCVEKPELLGPLFRRFLEKRIFMYEHYCRNKPVSEYIVSENEPYFQEIRHKLGHKLQLADLLIKPIQRIQKYHLLLKKILSYSELAECPPHVIASLTDAMKCSAIIPKNANSMMDVGRLQGFTGNIQAQGKLLRQDTMLVADISKEAYDRGREKETHMFLFEQCVIFSDPIGRRSQFVSPTYHYRAHIQMNKMELTEDSETFMIHSLDRTKPRMSFACRSDAHRQEWLKALKHIIQSQLSFGVALENPGAYLRELREPLQLKTSSPVTGTPEVRSRSQRPHSKANTINLPTNIRYEERKKVGGSAIVSPTSPPHANGLSKRPWALKLRRGTGASTAGDGGDAQAVEMHPPTLASPATDVSAVPGGTATLSCRAVAVRATASWRKTAPETRALRHGGRFGIMLASDGLATLTIRECRPSDAGVYCCLVSNELGGVQSSARLSVAAVEAAPGAPCVRVQPAGGLAVQWEEVSPVHLDYCRVGEGEWRRASETPACSGTVTLEELPAGQYSFRLVSAATGVAGAAAAAAACGPGTWQRDQFARRYAAEEELGRGRTARVLAARDTGTGQRVALKQVRGGIGADAWREYRILSRVAHGGVARALALFAEVPCVGAHTLVLELVGGGPLLEWAAASPQAYTHSAVAHHAKQLLSALQYLHDNNIAHLDVRPENILVELGGATPQLKLIDLGSAVEMCGDGTAGGVSVREVLPPAPAQLEFAPPECVLGRPPGPAWDAWAAGVFIYVFLTGLSPFLDECVEETTENIIKCDYCFPAEHWQDAEGAQPLVRGLLQAVPANRLLPKDALLHPWFNEAPNSPLSVTQLKTFLDRRRPAGHGNVLHSLRSPSEP